jgi:protein-S-isoprenylcysteine O-methyltransferase Ste14
VGPPRRRTGGRRFGLLTVLAGGRVLLGADPGYAAFLPLLVFNTAMGAVYLLAALLLWRSAPRGRRAAGTFALVNLAVLLVIVVHRTGGGPVAGESMAAMTLRTGVWTGIYLLVRWSMRGASRRGEVAGAPLPRAGGAPSG